MRARRILTKITLAGAIAAGSANHFAYAQIKTLDDITTTTEATPLQWIWGITYRVDNDNYYVVDHNESCMVHVPPELKSHYIGHAIGPNQVEINGKFKFVCNTRGTNGFGATVNIEVYEAVVPVAPKAAGPLPPWTPTATSPEFSDIKIFNKRLHDYTQALNQCKKNPITRSKLRDRFGRELAACVGQSVVWEFKVEHIQAPHQAPDYSQSAQPGVWITKPAEIYITSSSPTSDGRDPKMRSRGTTLRLFPR